MTVFEPPIHAMTPQDVHENAAKATLRTHPNSAKDVCRGQAKRRMTGIGLKKVGPFIDAPHSMFTAVELHLRYKFSYKILSGKSFVFAHFRAILASVTVISGSFFHPN